VTEGLGLWAACPAAPAVAAQPTTVAPAAGLAAQPSSSCDPSYPTICIPFGAADLDCPDIPHRRFEVLAPDPHRFDGDKDGIGCEK
jgi:micrococcal nuclease